VVSISEHGASAGVTDVVPLRGQVETWRIDWFNLYGATAYHVLTVLAFTPWFFSWYGLAFALIGHYTIGLLGVNLCYHRLLTHRSFACPRSALA
jgi:fatty-acid desaturase